MFDQFARDERHPFSQAKLDELGGGIRPTYYVVTYDGVEDLLEFRCAGPVVWMVDEIDKVIKTPPPKCPEIDTGRIRLP